MKTAICTLIKNEHKFIKEWVDYHLSIGIDDIYLFEDWGSNSHADIFKDYEHCKVIPLEGNTFGIRNTESSYIQLQTWTYFLNKCKKDNSYDWVLFNDNDEFLMFEEGYNLEKLLSEFEDYPGIHLTWKMYGANGYIKSPKGGVLENYTKPCSDDEKCDKMPTWNHKSFVNIHKAVKFDNLHIIHGGVDTNFDPKGYSTTFCYKKAWLNHYYSKSWEDYVWRMVKRGNLSNNYRTYDRFFDTNKDMLPKKEKLINSIRNIPLISATWISKDLKLVAGGNKRIIDKLKKKLFDK